MKVTIHRTLPGVWIVGASSVAIDGNVAFTAMAAPSWAEAMRLVPSVRTKHRQELAGRVGMEPTC